MNPALGGVPPDLIRMDNVMPRLRGVEVIRRIKMLPNVFTSSIVVLSSHISPEDAAVIKGLKIDAFQKGFSFKSLVACMRIILLPDPGLR